MIFISQKSFVNYTERHIEHGLTVPKKDNNNYITEESYNQFKIVYPFSGATKRTTR